MPYADVPAFVAKLRETAHVSNYALEFLILTAARSGEAIGTRWPEIDLDAARWTVPAERMKGGKEHIVPLPPRAVEILRLMQRWRQEDQEFVFAGRTRHQQLSGMSLAMALRRAGGGSSTVHGFRSSFRDWAGDETTFAREVAEAALAHAVRDATEAAYRRATAIEKRRQLLEAWADYLDDAEVMPLQMVAAE
jgi:integrase